MKILYFLAFCISLGLYLGYLFDVGINTTSSLPKGFYMQADTREIKHNDNVKFCLSEEKARLTYAKRYVDEGFCESGTLPLLKTVVGMSGDKIEVKEERVFITKQGSNEAVFYGFVRKFDSFGEKITSLLEEGVIPQGKVYVYANHKGSYDSRYYGLIEIKELTKMKEFLLF